MTSGKNIQTTNTVSALAGTTGFNVKFRAANVEIITAFTVESVLLSRKTVSACITATAPRQWAMVSPTLESFASSNPTTFVTAQENPANHQPA